MSNLTYGKYESHIKTEVLEPVIMALVERLQKAVAAATASDIEKLTESLETLARVVQIPPKETPNDSD